MRKFIKEEQLFEWQWNEYEIDPSIFDNESTYKINSELNYETKVFLKQIENKNESKKEKRENNTIQYNTQ